VPISGLSRPLRAYISTQDTDQIDTGAEEQLKAEAASRGLQGLEVLRANIETFNSIKTQGSLRWLTPPKNGSTTGSIVLAMATKEVCNRLILRGLTVANETIRVVPYRPSSPKTLYGRCQQFGHEVRGYRKTPKCRLCGKNHFTWSHACETCGHNNSKPYSHLDR